MLVEMQIHSPTNPLPTFDFKFNTSNSYAVEPNGRGNWQGSMTAYIFVQTTKNVLLNTIMYYPNCMTIHYDSYKYSITTYVSISYDEI
jgi:hypothetical protein